MHHATGTSHALLTRLLWVMVGVLSEVARKYVPPLYCSFTKTTQDDHMALVTCGDVSCWVRLCCVEPLSVSHWGRSKHSLHLIQIDIDKHLNIWVWFLHSPFNCKTKVQRLMYIVDADEVAQQQSLTSCQNFLKQYRCCGMNYALYQTVCILCCLEEI